MEQVTTCLSGKEDFLLRQQKKHDLLATKVSMSDCCNAKTLEFTEAEGVCQECGEHCGLIWYTE
jgi:hypothetical protein